MCANWPINSQASIDDRQRRIGAVITLGDVFWRQDDIFSEPE